ncbi:tetratricopeptide repeat protein [Bradyrhizobium sp. RT10b]|uniref:tetratricopeptide repeat protein n=1 Tax=Bradyrhizobium sp. RT10b TaxID=3156331 RepID=UPI003398AD90
MNTIVRSRLSAFGDRRKRGYVVAVLAALLLLACGEAYAQSLGQGVGGCLAGLHSASRTGQRRRAQSHLGFMFETGRGVPQNYTEAAMWYRRAADSLAQYSLGLLYDRGQGVPRDIVEASKWLNLAAAAGARGAGQDPRCRHHNDDACRDRGGAGMDAEPRALKRTD